MAMEVNKVVLEVREDTEVKDMVDSKAVTEVNKAMEDRRRSILQNLSIPRQINPTTFFASTILVSPLTPAKTNTILINSLSGRTIKALTNNGSSFETMMERSPSKIHKTEALLKFLTTPTLN